MKILKEFISKKNNVFLIIDEDDKKCIYKKFSSKDKCHSEILCLENLNIAQVNVPRIIKKADNALFLEYIEGCNLCDFIDNMFCYDSSQICNIADILSSHLIKLYSTNYFQKNNYILNDVNLRNFIFYKDKIYSIDFEDIRKGDLEEDIAGIVFYILTNNPPFTEWRIKLAKCFYNKINSCIRLNKNKSIKYVNNWIKKIEKRRKCKFTEIQISQINDIIFL